MRRKSSFLNIITGIGSQLILIVLGLISRKIFVNIMGLEILGINGLFSNIISMLSLAELGIGGAIYYSLYKPLANEDYPQVRATMQLYGKLYKYIALAVACIGLTLVPFIHLIIKENINNVYLISVYLCFLTDSVLSYILSYKKNIISADQNGYVINTIQTCFSIAISLAQIIIIIATHNFILYLIVKTMLGFLSNVVFHIIANRMYPFLKDKEKVKLSDESKAQLIKNAKALFISSIAGYCVFGTDNILISLFVSITAVGLYSNYLLIINIVDAMVSQVFIGIQASFGNFLLKESLDKSHNIFNIVYFINFWVTSFCSVCLIVLLNLFISLWIGKNALFPFYVLIVMVTNFYMRSMLSAIEIVRNGAGLYSPYPFFKYWALVEGILNLILGVTLAGIFKMGIIGILIATTITTQIIIFVMPWNVYKYVFKRSAKTYYKKNIIYLICVISITFITLKCCSFITITNSILVFLIEAIVCFVVPNLIIIALFYKTKEFKYIWNIGKGVIAKLCTRKPIRAYIYIVRKIEKNHNRFIRRQKILQEEITLDFKAIFSVIKRKLIFIIMITVLCTMVSAIFSIFVVKPTYQTDMSIIIGKINQTDTSSLSDLTIYQQLIKTYVAIASSNSVAEDATKKLKNIDAKTLSKGIKITPQTDTQIIDIVALAGTPKMAYDNINALTDSFIAQAMKIYPTGSIAILDSAVLPIQPIKPNKKLNILIAFFIGLMTSVAIVFTLEYLDRSIKTEEDVQRYLELSVIATIPIYKST